MFQQMASDINLILGFSLLAGAALIVVFGLGPKAMEKRYTADYTI